MACNSLNIFTFDRSLLGLKTVTGLDNNTFRLDWYQSYLSSELTYTIFYNIYFSSNESDVYSEGVKYIIASPNLTIDIQDNFRLGDLYYFSVRATAFENNSLAINQLPFSDSNSILKILPETLLTENITDSSLSIPVVDSSQFPSYGILQIGGELIGYSTISGNNLILSSIAQRGLYGTNIRLHNTDGYDGVKEYSALVKLFKGFEDGNTVIGCAENKSTFNYTVTTDGYHEKVDIVTAEKDLDIVDAENIDFPVYDYSGYHRTNPADLLNGKCIGTYIGGQSGCAESDESIGPVRGMSVQDANTQREEMLLNVTGRPVVLFTRQWKGKTSLNYDSHRENTAYRGMDTYGTDIVSGYTQYFNPRRSDGRIMVRFGPVKESLDYKEEGIENVYQPDCWTLVVPSVKNGDFIIKYNNDGSEEWRYEITGVTRNDMFLSEVGRQTFTTVRVRKTDPIYQVPVFGDTSKYPSEITTSIFSGTGMPPHLHRLVINEGISTTWTQLTSVSQGHSHSVVVKNGILTLLPALGHEHSILI